MAQRKKVMVIFGTRPEATKMGPVVHALKNHSEWFDTKVIVTGQQREQLDQVLSYFDIQPDFDLTLMKPKQSLAYVTSAAIAGLDSLLTEEKPDLILVHGDTQTTLCGGLVASFHKIPLGHIEAGLRSHNKHSPWPEELNRRLVDVVADFLFAPTRGSRDNLLREGFGDSQIFVSGQTAIDAALQTYRSDYTFHEEKLTQILNQPGKVITMTVHRKENYGEPMLHMFRALRRIVDDHPEVSLVYPVHLSPIVRETAFRCLSGHDRIHLLDPINYPDMIHLLARSYLIASDSGGLQEEAPVFHKPLVLMRETTERPEAVSAKAAYLAGTQEEDIYGAITKLLRDKSFYHTMARRGLRNEPCNFMIRSGYCVPAIERATGTATIRSWTWRGFNAF